MKIVKIKDSRRIKVEFEGECETNMFDFLYEQGLIKGVYAYKKSEFAEIDLSAYSNKYNIEHLNSWTETIEEKNEIEVIDFDSLFNTD